MEVPSPKFEATQIIRKNKGSAKWHGSIDQMENPDIVSFDNKLPSHSPFNTGSGDADEPTA